MNGARPGLRRPAAGSGLSELGDDALAGLDELVGLDAEDVVPGAGGRPHLGPLQQVGVDEDAQMGLVPERRHADVVV
jgi:hypothetical protein